MASKSSNCLVCACPLPEGASADSPVFPFCSVRCRQIDLLRWCKGDYAVVDDLSPDRLYEALAEASDPEAFDA